MAQSDSVGVGDELIAGGNTYHISGRQSSTVYAVTSITGTEPADLSSTSVTSIKREFNTISDAETDSSDSSHLNSNDLTPSSANTVLQWQVYNDGAFDEIVDINGYVTDASHYLHLLTPDADDEAGTSQRHTGAEGTGAVIQRTLSSGSGTYPVIDVNDDYVRGGRVGD